MKLAKLLAVSMALAGPNHKEATNTVINQFNVNQITITNTSNPQQEGSKAIYGYYNTDAYIDLGVLRIRSKTITTGIVTTNNTGTSIINNSAFTYIEVQNPNGYAYELTINTQGTTNIDPNVYDTVIFNHATDIETNTYDINQIDTYVYTNFTNVIDVHNQIWTDIDQELSSGQGWTENYTTANITTNEQNYRSIIQAYKNTLTKTYEMEAEATNTDTQCIAYIVNLQATKNYLTEFEKQEYINVFDNHCNTITFNLKYVGPNITPTVEVIDLPGLMFTVLGMPFAWISTAFNFTLFPGTPYAINISHIFMAIIVASILIFIIKRLLK